MRQFRWFSAGPVPVAYDLRRLGWQLLGDLSAARNAAHDPAHVLLGLPWQLPLPQWLHLASGNLCQRKWIMLLEVSDSAERARMLQMGFGDALDFGASLEELESRVLRLTQFAHSLLRYRFCGALKIDLLVRDAFVAGRALGLHPREFALLWRLSDTPGEAVSRHELLNDVWRLSFQPETNSLAVHISRLRSKLRLGGIDGLIETLLDGAYRLAAAQRGLMGSEYDLGLDGYLRMGKEYRIAASSL